MKSNKYRLRFFIPLIAMIFTASLLNAQTPGKRTPPIPSGIKSKQRVAKPKSKAPVISEKDNSGKEVTFQFNGIDIRVFIELIAGLTDKTFLIDDRVKGKVTIVSPPGEKLTPKEAYAVFESVLEVYGYTTVESGKVIKIVSSPEARTKNIETRLRESALSPDDNVITQLISLKYADVNEVKRLLSPLISKSSVMLAYTPTNMLIITDVQSNIRRLAKIIKTIDVTGIGQEITVLPLKYADASKMVKNLTTVFSATRKTKGKKGIVPKSIKFVADERTNTVVTLAGAGDTKRVKQLIRLLDKEMPKGKEKIHVYYLEHATAEDLAKTLQSLSSKPKKTTAKGKKQAPIVSEGVNITADKATNSLIIMAEKDDYLVLEAIIEKLDIPRAMVYIECLIMEVNIETGFNIGTEWMAMGETSYEGTQGAYGGGFGGASDSGYDNLGGLLAPGVGLLPEGLSLGVFSEGIRVGDVLFPTLNALVQAMKKDKNVNILSTPQILTTDNEEASIMVGQNVPYQTRTGTTSSSETYNTYEYKDVAISLKVTPQISKDRMIRLKIEQEVSRMDVASADTEDERPTTLKRTINTTVIVDDKNTIAIGGLIDDSFSHTEYKIPCLGEIPGLGWLFKSMSKGNDKTNLFLFLTPHVIENKKEAKALYQKKKRYIDEVEEGRIKLYPSSGRRSEEAQETVEKDAMTKPAGDELKMEKIAAPEIETEPDPEETTISIPWQESEETGIEEGTIPIPAGDEDASPDVGSKRMHQQTVQAPDEQGEELESEENTGPPAE